MNENQTEMARYESDKIAFAQRLNLALDELNWPQRGRIAQLKRTLREDLSEISVRKWLRGDGLPEVKRLGELSRITGKSVQWLLTGTDTNSGDVEPQPYPVYRVPLISWVRAGEFKDRGFAPTLEEAEETITSPVRAGPRAYAVVVKGDSMISSQGGKSYPEGTVIIVDPDIEPAPGKKVIARYGNDMTFKELVLDAGNWWLKPLNPQYPMLQVTEDVEICAVLVCAVMIE
ncbi:LexA family protein [Aeromonas veronii]